MNMKMTTCKACGQEIAKSAKACPHCGAKNKKPIFKKWWFWAIVVVLIISIGKSVDSTTNNNENKNDKVEEPAKTEYYVGDILEDGNTKIVFMSSGDYTEENKFM